jgi:DNA-binding NarL/FixJ family response regulator
MTRGIQVVQVLLVEDEHRTAQAIASLLTAAGNISLRIAGTVEDARAKLTASMPDLILLDLHLPDGDGIDLMPDIRARALRARVLVLTAATAGERVLGALGSGVHGFLFKDDVDRLTAAVRETLRGDTPLSAGAATMVVQQLQLAGSWSPRPRLSLLEQNVPRLTSQEQKVLEHLAMGYSYAGIADELKVSVNTIRTHVRSLYEKFGAESGKEAVNLAWALGLLRRKPPS